MQKTIPATLQKWGNSAAIRIPATTMKALNIDFGQSLALTVKNGALVATPTQRRYSLTELVAQCNPRARFPDDLAEWEGMPQVGNEAI